MRAQVTFKSVKFESHWIYVLEESQSGNSTETVICFENTLKNEMSGLLIVGEWELEGFFELANMVLDKLPQVTKSQKSVQISLSDDNPVSFVFRAEKENQSDWWKVIFRCEDPSQPWKTWNSGSGSPKNLILYLSWAQIHSLIESLARIPEIAPEDAGHIHWTDTWVENASLDELDKLPTQILSIAREGLIQFEKNFQY